jgi:hypothetical protein
LLSQVNVPHSKPCHMYLWLLSRLRIVLVIAEGVVRLSRGTEFVEMSSGSVGGKVGLQFAAFRVEGRDQDDAAKNQN